VTRQELIAYSAGASVAAIVVLSAVYISGAAPGPRDQLHIFKAAEEIIEDTRAIAPVREATAHGIEIKPTTTVERSSW